MTRKQRDFIIAILIISLLCLTFTHGQNAVKDNLIHHFPFDGNLNNAIDPTKPAQTIPGGEYTVTEDRLGQANKAINIDDSKIQPIVLPNEVLNNLYSFTMTAWIKPHKTIGIIISLANPSTDNLLQLSSGGIYERYGQHWKFFPTRLFEDKVGTWLHYAVVRDQANGTITVYKDGVQYYKLTGATTSRIYATGIVIGQDMDSVLGDYDIATQMNASFYDYRFYNTAKTISEINEIKNYINCLENEYSVLDVGCFSCRERYATCSAEDIPESCDGNNRKPVNQDCQCLDHHYEDPLTENCLECRERYGNCSDEATPISCQGLNRKPLGDDCVCLDRHYEDPLSINCLECRERYGSCSGESSPDSCQGSNRKSLGEDCVCKDHFYQDPLSINCLECRERYGSCLSISVPLTCQGINRKSKDDDCLCQDHFYEDSLSIDCLECKERYGSCSSESNPLSCQGNSRKSKDDDCVCLDRHYEDPLSINCLECKERYGSCLGESIPLSCQGINRKSIDDDCVCLEGFYEDSYSYNCVKCPRNFETCSDEHTPLSCSGLNRKGINQSCVCQDGYFENPLDTNCYPCQYPCACNEMNCAVCGNYPYVCQTFCHESCSQCDITGNCTNCPLGSSLNNGQCEKCDSKCEICDLNNKHKCLTCSYQNNDQKRSQDPSNNCDCIDGFYENQDTKKCVQCVKKNCKICDSKGICLQCFKEELLPPLCQQNKIGFLIPVASMDVQNDVKCAPGCDSCSLRQNLCTSCSFGLNRNQDLPCDCVQGFHDQNGSLQDCQKCPLYCAVCENSEICLKCEDQLHRELDRYSGQCSCIDGYKENQQKMCVRCYQYKGECLLTCPKITLQNGKSYICETMNYPILDMIVLIWTCCIIVLVLMLISRVLGIFFVKKQIQNTYIGNQQKQNKLEKQQVEEPQQ